MIGRLVVEKDTEFVSFENANYQIENSFTKTQHTDGDFILNMSIFAQYSAYRTGLLVDFIIISDGSARIFKIVRYDIGSKIVFHVPKDALEFSRKGKIIDTISTGYVDVIDEYTHVYKVSVKDVKLQEN